MRNLSINDACKILDVTKSSSVAEIKKNFRTKAMTCHPDKFPGNKRKESQFKKLSHAYEALMSYHSSTKNILEAENNFMDEIFGTILNSLDPKTRQDFETFLRDLDSEDGEDDE